LNLKLDTKNLSIAKLLAQAIESLTNHGVPTARLDAEVLLAYVLGLSRASVYARLQDVISEADVQRFHQLLHRRQQREPLQYITGVQEFWSLEFHVTPYVLIPRPETELVVETALHLLGEKQKAKMKNPPSDSGLWTLDPRPLTPGSWLLAPKILDVGTGSGCIAIALAKEIPSAEIWATDLSSAALAVAQDNARRHGVTERLHFLHGDLFTPLRDQQFSFDLIVSNPPYIIHDDLVDLQPEVRDWEPQRALDGGPDGLNFYRRLLTESPNYLRTSGWLILEIGHGQATAILQIAQQQSQLTASSCLLDYEGHERVVAAQKQPGKSSQK